MGVVLAQERRRFCWKYFENVCTVKIAVMGRLSLKLVVSFVGTYHRAMSAMHEHLKRKHPIETEGDQPKNKNMDLSLK